MNRFMQAVLHPERYHGDLFRPPFFEGWYFKLVTADQKKAYAIIPGISISKDEKESHAFVQVLDGNTGTVHVARYPVSSFHSDSKMFNVTVGENHFSLEGISMDLKAADGFSLAGRVCFGESQPWPVQFHSPGIMGPFGWLGFMECYHGLLSFDHSLSGFLEHNQQEVGFNQGRGYIEKDWGKAFPSSWVWMQTNHFDQPGTSISVSVAVIPMGVFSFTGVIIGLWHQGRLHAFTTYNGARLVQFKFNEQQVTLKLVRGEDEIEIQAEREKGGYLAAPSLRGMDRRIMESLNGKIAVHLKKKGQLIFKGLGLRAGMEIVGDVAQLKKLGKI